MECLLEQWDKEQNGTLTPRDVFCGSHKQIWWRCDKGHEWLAQIKSRTSGAGCPVCANRMVKTGENDLATTHPALAGQWHPERNGTLTPQEVVAGNCRKVWWRCEKGHEWQAQILARSNNGNGCPVCAGKQVIPGENDLASAFPRIAAQWHPTKNGTRTPENVTAYSNRRAWWICELGHEYQTIIAHRTNAASACPYCAGRKVLEGFNDLATKQPGIAAQWHPELNGTLTPQMVTVGSRKKVWWQCGEGHSWKAAVYSRSGVRKCGCPVCAGKITESRQKRYAEIAAAGQLIQREENI